MSEEEVEFKVTNSGSFNDQRYVIDFDKVNAIDDVIRILKAMNLTMYGDHAEEHGIIDLVKKDE